jgi:hypothetical protein
MSGTADFVFAAHVGGITAVAVASLQVEEDEVFLGRDRVGSVEGKEGRGDRMLLCR